MTVTTVPALPVAKGMSRTVVATVVRHHGAIALLRRSRLVGSDVGLWHCVTGYLDRGNTPSRQARQELQEELGFQSAADLEHGPVISLADDAGQPWRVHTFALEVVTRRVALNWEHDAVCWVNPDQRHHLHCVPWLDQVLAAVTNGLLEKGH